MQVRVSDSAPIPKLDPQFESRLRLADEIVFVDPKELIERADRRDGRFTDTDSADLGRLNNSDGAIAILQNPGKMHGLEIERIWLDLN
jgi:hypothetical protein